MKNKRVRFKKLMVANRSEIAIRVMRAANELGLRTVAIYSNEDRFALHRFKADEAYQVGSGSKPLAAYLDIDGILSIAITAGVDAIHPGYGFLAENPEFAARCEAAGITFIGPGQDVMRALGNKVNARELAAQAGVPVVPASEALPRDLADCAEIAGNIGYPLMLKASWGGGGRGMRVLENAADLEESLDVARREAAAAFGNDEVYVEKLVRHARHVEVQVLGDSAGNLVHLFERDCSVQRRNQKVVERAPASYLSDSQRETLCGLALRLAAAANYVNAGTVEFLMDVDSGEFYFIEVNPRIQVEHTVTEEVTGIDIVKAQIRIAEGVCIGDDNCPVPAQADIHLNGHALQCRITTEDPENNFVPDYGRIRVYRGATGFGIRLDGGTAFSGALITPFYDSLLEKVTAWAPTPEEAIRRMDRALREFRIRGVATNLAFVENLINHPRFRTCEYTTRFIDETPELFRFPKRRDRATRLLRFIGDVAVNGNPEIEGRPPPRTRARAPVPPFDVAEPPPGSVQRLAELGPSGFAQWMLDQDRVLLTDTTMRDAHQSLHATRMRSRDMFEVAPAYARLLPQLLSLECWGGATFDVAMRFLHEDPWDRLAGLKESVPNILLQMLLRSSNAVGYTNYPDNVVRHFVHHAADGGVDLFRIFDALNWVDNMRVAMDAVLAEDKLCEAAICYSGDMLAAHETKYTLDYYLGLATDLAGAGAHIIGIKDMAGVCKPAAAGELVRAIKAETGKPVHFHTHDTSGIAAASVLAAIEAGVDAVDGAMDAMSGLTSQPNLGAIVEALRDGPRDCAVERDAMRSLNHYWETVREYYRPFESGIHAGTADVYRHAMPGGQYTNLREQARALGIEQNWPQIAETYADVNDMFGNIVKVTPTSKVVGDMALFMVTSGLSREDVEDPTKDIDFPASVVSFFRGELGQPPGGFPQTLQRKVLKNQPPLTDRPGADLPPVDLDDARKTAEKGAGRQISDKELVSYLMYPQVFLQYAAQKRKYGEVSVLPSPVFFYGMEEDTECAVDIELGKTLIIRYLAVSEPNESGERNVFFELNGQPRLVRIEDRHAAKTAVANRKAEDGNPAHVAAPMPGLVVNVAVKAGDKLAKGDALLSIEAMKMETQIHADRDCKVREVVVHGGTQVDAKDLLLVLAELDD
ncbi:MAG: pyruvate carboxylase [Chromatiales bacterium]|nr:pyruvate carboxylase [Chromatiales bacterium]